jgi:diacylglycerol kinase (ATP)
MDGSSVIGQRVGVLVNPKSGRGNGKGLAFAAMVKQFSHVDVVVIEQFSQIREALEDFCANRVGTICISSGDGTIQHVQTVLAEELKPLEMPTLCLMPHGTTNMTAADIGFHSGSLARQAAFVRNPAPASTVARPSLRISNSADGLVRHGMFLGTGAVALATKYCQTKLNDRGVHGSFATSAVLAIALGKTMFGRKNSQDNMRFDQAHDISLSVDGLLVTKGQQLLGLCTTLHKLILGSRPFWGGESDDIRVMSLAFPPPSILRWTLPLLYGGEGRRMPPEAVSQSGSRVLVSSSTPYVVDGEFFDGPTEGAIAIELGPRVTYIRS